MSDTPTPTTLRWIATRVASADREGAEVRRYLRRWADRIEQQQPTPSEGAAS